MSILENLTSNVEKVATSFESGVDKIAAYEADRSSQIWTNMRDGARNISRVASDLPEFLDFGAKSIFDSQVSVQASLGAASFAFRAGAGETITDGTSNTVLVGERPDGDFSNREGGREGGNSDCHNNDGTGRDGDHNYDDRDHDHNADHGHRHHNDNHGERHDGGHHDWDQNGQRSEYDLYENDGWRYCDDSDACCDNGASPVEMLQQMQDISQQLAQLTQLLAASGFGGMQIGGMPGQLPFIGQGGAGGPAEVIGEIAELAKKLAPLASALAPALIALI